MDGSMNTSWVIQL